VSRAQVMRGLLELDPPVAVNTQGYNGQTALANACATGYLEGVLLLLRYGADPEIANARGWSPLMLAAKHGHVEVAQVTELFPCLSVRLSVRGLSAQCVSPRHNRSAPIGWGNVDV
jgi:ankyrin repeat protein